MENEMRKIKTNLDDEVRKKNDPKEQGKLKMILRSIA